MNAQEKQEWDAARVLGDRARREIRGHELAYYLSRLEQIRATTLLELSQRDDGWLQVETVFGNEQRANNYFKWFHVLGHEVNHRGQIRWLRARASRQQA